LIGPILFEKHSITSLQAPRVSGENIRPDQRLAPRLSAGFIPIPVFWRQDPRGLGERYWI
jgi:hypothetical protein